MTRHAALPVLIPVAILVIAAAMTIVRPELLKIIPAPMLLRPSADHVVTGVKAARPVQVPLIPVLMPRLPNAAAVIDAPIPVLPEQRVAFPVQETMSPRVFLLQNAVPAAMNADITLTVPQQIKIVIMVVLIRTLAVSAHPASLAPTAALQDQHLFLAPAGRRKKLSEQLNAAVLVTNARHHNGVTLEKQVLDPVGVERIMGNIGMFVRETLIVLMVVRKSLFVH